MRNTLKVGLLVLLSAVAPAQAQSQFKQIATIEVPGKPFDSFDAGYVDQNTHRYYFADRTNQAVDIFDTQTNKFVGRIGGLMGDGPDDVGGPNSLVITGGYAFITDGDSKVKVADLKTNKIVAAISTDGKKQADESGYDDKDHILAITNGSDKPGFVTFISTEMPYKLLGKVVIERATDGIEQPVYDSASGMFYIAIPQLDKSKSLGGVVEVDPNNFKVTKTMNVQDCVPHGMVVGPGGAIVIACHSPKSSPPPAAVALNPKTGELTRIPGIAGGDLLAYNVAAGQYYVTGNHMPGGPVFGVIDAKTDKWLENVSAPGNPHSIATEESSKHIFVPVPAKTPLCPNSCIAVYAPQ